MIAIPAWDKGLIRYFCIFHDWGHQFDSAEEKELKRDQDEAGTDGDALTSAKAEVCRHTYDLYRVR